MQNNLITMTHIYYDFYMRFPSDEDATNAQNYYNTTYKPRIGGKFVINDNGVCSLSLRDECEIITDFYKFGMKRYILVDNYHGLNRRENIEYFDFQTDTDNEYSFEYNEATFERINSFLKEEIDNDGFVSKQGEHAPIISRIIGNMGIDDLYDMLNVNAPGFDI